ncbi:MAG: hypothetical protein ABI112_01145 [Terracoccus sp.]
MSAHTETDERAFRETVAELEALADSVGGGAEGLDRASCSPAVVYLAQVGMGAAARGCSAQGWRTEVGKIRGPEGVRQLDEAEECMRHSGLWPWA